jgi:hypothetical protein
VFLACPLFKGTSEAEGFLVLIIIIIKKPIPLRVLPLKREELGIREFARKI